jgi:hypothetical protein
MKWSRWLTWLGIVIALLGVVALIWTQAQSPFGGGGFGFNTAYRWQIAMGPLDVIGIGVVVSIAAQIMGMMQASRTHPESN